MGYLLGCTAMRALLCRPGIPGLRLLVRPSSGTRSLSKVVFDFGGDAHCPGSRLGLQEREDNWRLPDSVCFPGSLNPMAGGPSWPQERTLVAVKPDGVQRRLVGTVIQRFERRGFKLVGMKMLQVWEGYNVVHISRAMIGHTDSTRATPGTIRGDFSVHISRNIIHASDSVEGAQREIQLWFQSSELVNWADGGHHSTCYPA
ncbi:nucleoside diphosphate kinase, mitochondrial isoform X2 [Nannospalax galili]|uniref:nucleoside diphosphate kinase, mitochondrial isoform X2 n=1 Tax=Nannospalax galili TaxID=1026970 RepID=UPI00111BDF84|nr:nucleoside diphosphate kinase, mitochondrial isoform X2 [Nannospalax galili]